MMGSWLMDVFGSKRPIIGMVHLPPLPGSPRYGGSMDLIVERALQDAKALEEGGVHALLVENFWDVPYRKVPDDPETIASASVAVREVVRSTSLPVGVNLLRNGGVQALAVAHAAGAKFIRVNVLTEAFVTDQGTIEGIADELLRRRRCLDPGIKILADVHVKYAKPLYGRPISSSAKDVAERGLADAIIVSGPRTGVPPDLRALKEVKEAAGLPVFVGSGLSPDNAEKLLSIADGAIVGTYFKEEGRVERPVDVSRVRELMKRLRA